MNREVHEITSPEDRRAWGDFTASNMGALFGVHPFATLQDVLARMRGEREPTTRSQRAGILLEAVFPVAVSEERPDWRIVKATTYHRLPNARLGASPDYWVFDDPRGDGTMETKTINERSWWDQCHGTPPLYWTLQHQTQLLVTGLKWGVIAVIVRNSDLPLYLFEVEAHPAAQQKILAAVADFWKRHDAGEFPVAAPADELAKMFDDGSHIDLSTDNYLPEALIFREELAATLYRAGKQKDEIDEAIKARLGKASTGWLPGWQLSWKMQHRKPLPATDFRVLRVRRTKESDDDDAR